MKEIVGLIAVILAIVALIPYIVDILQHKTKPHVFTWVVWALVTLLAFLGQWQKGGGPGSWTTAITGFITILIALLALRYGSKDITKSDKVFFIAALLAVIPWLLTKDPTVSVVILTTIDVLAFFPTIRKTIKNPETETFFTYPVTIIRHGLSIVALSNYSIATYIYPAALLVMNIVMLWALTRPKK